MTRAPADPRFQTPDIRCPKRRLLRSLVPSAFAILAFTFTACTGEHTCLDRFVQRTPLPRQPVPHTDARAGHPLSVSRLAEPSMTCHDYGGYVGGGSLKNNTLHARGPGSATGPLVCGTYGTDYGGVHGHLGRVFLAPSDDPSRGYPISWNYRAEGPRVTDVLALRPFRKAVLELHEDAHERKYGHEEHAHGEPEEHGAGHAEGGHEPEGATAPEGKHPPEGVHGK